MPLAGRRRDRTRSAALGRADRHYLAVVAAEARRLARDLRPRTSSPQKPRRIVTGRAHAEGSR